MFECSDSIYMLLLVISGQWRVSIAAEDAGIGTECLADDWQPNLQGAEIGKDQCNYVETAGLGSRDHNWLNSL